MIRTWWRLARGERRLRCPYCLAKWFRGELALHVDLDHAYEPEQRS